MKLSNNKILVTGGGSGIGLGLTERFLKEDNTLIICGRRESVLKDVVKKYPQVITKICDLSKESERETLFAWITEKHSDLNVLVNNAGIQQWMSVLDEDFIQKAKDEIAINVEAPLHLTSLFLKLNSLQTVINVTSGLSYVPMARMPVYSATKAFFHSYTLSLRHNLRSKNIEVIEIIPPALNTDLGGKGLHNSAPPVNDFIDAVFLQLALAKTEISFGFSEAMAKAGPEELQKAFDRMNSV
jgi:uncharacterized oxidoreductase